METYADLIRDLRPMDDDLDGLGAPLEAIRMVQSLTDLLMQDFKARFGVEYLSVPTARR